MLQLGKSLLILNVNFFILLTGIPVQPLLMVRLVQGKHTQSLAHLIR